MMFREIITVFSDNRMKPLNTFCGQNVESLPLQVGGINDVCS